MGQETAESEAQLSSSVKPITEDVILESTAAKESSVPPSVPAAEEFPDPDEDDLDDLDDMLDEFSTARTETKAVPATSGPGRPATASDAPKPEDGVDGISDEDFAKQLQAGMADLLGELGTDPDMKAQFENMLKELGGGEGLGDLPGIPTATPSVPTSKAKSTPSASKASPSNAAAEESFQETIRKTMERMQASGDKATAAASENDGDDILAELMKQMGSGALGGEGGEEDFSKMLLGMMEQLTNKEILYEPMKELDDKFPVWMEKNKDTTPAADMDRYKEQQKVVREIVAKFEEKTYSDSDAASREYIVDRMQKMQAAGSPPPDLVGDMAAAQEAFGIPGDMDEGCAQQ